MTDDLLTFLVLAPGWVTGLLLLVMGSRARGLARPLWNAERVDGTVVAHEAWRSVDGRERTGIVVDFIDASGQPGRLIEPPVRWERPPDVGCRVRISHRSDDAGFAKRYSRRSQLFAWLATLVSVPLVVLFLVTHPVPMAVVTVPLVVLVSFRRWWPPAAPVRVPTDLSAVGVGGFDPKAMVVPTSPPALGSAASGPELLVPESVDREARPAMTLPSGLDILHRHFYPVVSGVVVLVVAVIGASRSSREMALGWHVGLALVLGVGVVLFETSLAHRGGSVVTGRVVDHRHRRDTEGDVYWLEVVEFRADRATMTFVDTAGHRRQRPVGSPVTVSYRAGEPERARSLHRSQSLLGTVLIAGAVGIGLFVSSTTWIPVLIQTAVCYLGFVVLDVVRGLAIGSAVLEPN